MNTKESTKESTKVANLADIDWDSIEDGLTEFAEMYPTIQWQHGDPRIETGLMGKGGFFLPEHQYGSLAADGWEKAVLKFKTGEKTEGYWAHSLHVAVLRKKDAWRTVEGRKQVRYKVLAAIKGLDGIFQISLPKPSKAVGFEAVIQSHIKQNVAFANRTRKEGAKPLQPFALWCHIQAGGYSKAKSKDGNSESEVTLPTLVTPSEITPEYIKSLWVGTENYKLFASYVRDSELWQNTPLFESHDKEGSEDSPEDFMLEVSRIQQLHATKTLYSPDKIPTEAELCQKIANDEHADRFTKLTPPELKQAGEVLAQL